MNEVVNIEGTEIETKEYCNQRVVTFADIDRVHQRPAGTARKRFNYNRRRFIEGVDFHRVTPSEFRTAIGKMDPRQQNEITLITESGYLMLAKSLTDDLAWRVQRELVNFYFRAKWMSAKISTRTLTTNDYMQAARTVSNCHDNRLAIVLDLYKKAGFDIPKLESIKPYDEDYMWQRAVELLNQYSVSEATEIIGDIPRTSLGYYRNGSRKPSESRCRIIIEKLGGESDVW